MCNDGPVLTCLGSRRTSRALTRPLSRVLLIVPFFNRDGLGEDFSNYKWIAGLAERVDVTVLGIRRGDAEKPLGDTAATFIAIGEGAWHRAFMRASSNYRKLSRGLKPSYLGFYRGAKRWLREHGAGYDIIHQLSPLALRYPSPAVPSIRQTGGTLIIGPLAGSLPTPRCFKEHRWLPSPRTIVDESRFRFDPWLRATFTTASCVIGVAPYVRDLIGGLKIRRFETISETGVDNVHTTTRRSDSDRPVSLLFVGRLVPEKGVLHAIRAMALLPRNFRATLKICGTGRLGPLCEREISRLGLHGTVELLGHVPKSEVFTLYGESDIFLFPSYREPSGNVVLESMSFGIPVITTTVGGTGHAVSDECGIRVPPGSPGRFEAELAEAILVLGTNRALMERMGRAARNYVERVALWPRKIDWMFDLYRDLRRTGRCRSRASSVIDQSVPGIHAPGLVKLARLSCMRVCHQ